MNNDIHESYCSFDVSKLLKSKGAQLNTHIMYDYSMYYYIHSKSEKDKKETYTYDWFNSFNNMLSAPTHALALEWIRVNFEIFISISVDTIFNKNSYCIHIYKKIGDNFDHHAIDNKLFGPYNLPKDAYDAALKYTLKKLI